MTPHDDDYGNPTIPAVNLPKSEIPQFLSHHHGGSRIAFFRAWPWPWPWPWPAGWLAGWPGGRVAGWPGGGWPGGRVSAIRLHTKQLVFSYISGNLAIHISASYTRRPVAKQQACAAKEEHVA